MRGDSGRIEAFADEMVAMVSEIAKKHGLDELVVHRNADPVLVAVRGCLRDGKSEKGEKIELVMQISPDIARADAVSIVGAQISDKTGFDVGHAFDLSEVVAKDTVAHAAQMPEDDEC